MALKDREPIRRLRIACRNRRKDDAPATGGEVRRDERLLRRCHRALASDVDAADECTRELVPSDDGGNDVEDRLPWASRNHAGDTRVAHLEEPRLRSEFGLGRDEAVRLRPE